MDSYFEEAKHWRQEYGNPQIEKTGFVLFFQGKIYGWKNALSINNARTERPGVIAVDIEGTQYQAVGGCDKNGAQKWEKVC